MHQAAVGDGLLSRRYRAMTLGIVASISLVAFEALAITTAMPTVAQALDGLRLYALAFGGTLAAAVIAIVLAGPWCDARGPAPPLWTGVALFVTGLLIAGSATTMPQLVIGRIVQGFGNGAISVALYVVVGRVYPESLRPRLFAAMSAAWVVPSLLGPALSGLIVRSVGWRWVFLAVPFLAVPAAALLAPGLRRLAPTRMPMAPIAAPLGWALLAALGACVLHAAGQREPGVVGALLLGGGLLGLGLGAWRLLPAGTLRARRGLPSVLVLRACVAAVFFGAEAFLPLMLEQLRGFTPLSAGIALSVGSLGWSLGAWLQGHPARDVARVRLLRTGLALMGAGVGVLALVVLVPVPAMLAAVGWALTGLGMGLAYPSLSLLTLALSAPEEQGRNAAALQLCDALSIASVLALGGAVYASLLERSVSAAFTSVFAFSALLAVAGVALSGRVRS